MANIPIREFLKLSLEEQKAVWYDWFCYDTSLLNKTKKLVGKLKSISRSSKINIDTQSVFFKNGCPGNGSLYDDFRICDLVTGEVIYTIIPSSGFAHKKGQSEVYAKENHFEEPLVAGEWKDVIKFFLGDFRSIVKTIQEKEKNG